MPMKRTFENVSRNLIIDHIFALHDNSKMAKLRIKTSLGTLFRIVDDKVLIQKSEKIYYNIGIENLNKEDLITILRYLENVQRCREIHANSIKYGEIFDVRKKTWKRYPCNEKEVYGKIMEYLSSKKKNVAIIDKRFESNPSIKITGNHIKKFLLELKNQFNKNSDVYYDNINKTFIIVIDRYDESQFGINLLHLMSEIKSKYKSDCIILSLKDYAKRMGNNITHRLTSF
jgi:hypothetical protein